MATNKDIETIDAINTTITRFARIFRKYTQFEHIEAARTNIRKFKIVMEHLETKCPHRILNQVNSIDLATLDREFTRVADWLASYDLARKQQK